MAAGAMAPVTSFAQTTTASSDVQAQLSLIATLTTEIQALQTQIANLVQQKQSATASLASTLSVGSQGNQVKVLQALLAADPSIYPEGLVTGYFGPATERAVKRFQEKNGIDQIGVVGPKTLKALNDALDQNPIKIEANASTSFGDNGQGYGRLCAIVPPGHLIAPGWLRKNDGMAPIIPVCQTIPPGIDNHDENSTSSSTNVATSTQMSFITTQ